MDPKEIVRRNCKQFREDAGLTQEQLGEKIGVTTDTVRSWEQKDPKTPDPGNLRAAARLYGRSMEDFFEAAPPPPKTPMEERIEARFKSFGLDEDLQREGEDHARILRQKQLDRIMSAKKKIRDKKRV